MALWVEQLLNAFGLIGPILLIAVSLSIALASVDVMNAAVGAIFVMSAIVAIRASALAGPVGFVLGAESPIPPDQAGGATADRIPSAWVEIIPDAGHFIWLERPGAVRAALDRLVRSV